MEDVQRATAHAALIDLMVRRLDGLKEQVWFYVQEPGEYCRDQIFGSIAQLERALQSMRADYEAPDVIEGEALKDDRPRRGPTQRVGGQPEAL